MSKNAPVIIIKKGGHGKHAHHGGAWKVAYADFVTAMMAFFLVMWLVNASPDVKSAVGSYFRDPGAFQTAGSSGILPGEPGGLTGGEAPQPSDVEVAQAMLERAATQLRDALQSVPSFKELADQVEIQVTPEGLRIELLESPDDSFFEVGRAELRSDTVALLHVIAEELAKLPNHVAIEGHTDSRPYTVTAGAYGNWELSADRANAARRVIEEGLPAHRIEAVRGFADTRLRYPEVPLDPRNRRISVVVRREG